MDEVSIDVPVEENGGRARRIHRVSGRADDSFVQLWYEGVPENSHMPFVMIRYRVDLGASQWSWDDLISVGPEVTLSQLAELTKDGLFSVEPGGWGGMDADWIEPMIQAVELIAGGYTLRGLKAQVAADLTQAQALRYRRHRRLAADWRDQADRSNIALELRQLIFECPAWYRTRFDAVFALDPATGTDLLKTAGFRKISSKKDIWVEQGRPDSTTPCDGRGGLFGKPRRGENE